MSKLKISDQEFIFAEKIVAAYLSKLIEVSTSYVKELSTISDAFGDKEINQKFVNLSENMSKITSLLEEMQSSLKGKSKIFIEEIDEIDNFIY